MATVLSARTDNPSSDPALEKEWRRSFEGDTPRVRRPIAMEVHGRAGQPMTLIARDEQGHVTQRESTLCLEQARKHPLTGERLREQLGRLGGSPFQMETLSNRLEGALILPVSELNRLRREVVADLEHQRRQPKR